MLLGQLGTPAASERDLGMESQLGDLAFRQAGTYIDQTEDRDHGYLRGGAKISKWKKRITQQDRTCPHVGKRQP